VPRATSRSWGWGNMQICFHFGDYSFNPETCDLFKKNRRLPIGTQVALFLAALLDSPGQIVSREKLESRLWPNQIVGPNNLNVVASQARKLFLDDPASPKFIKTVGQRGYCFIYPIDSTKDGKHPDAAAAAESYYRRGLYLCEVSAECDMQQSVRAFSQAIAENPNHALAHAGLANAFIMSAMYGRMPPEEGFLRARSAAAHALQIDSSLIAAKCSESWVKLCFDRNWTGAHEGFTEAIRADPDYPFAWNGLSLLQNAFGNSEEALKAIRTAWVHDAASPRLSAILAFVYYFARRFRNAVDQSQNAIAFYERSAQAHSCMGLSCLQLNELPRALRHLRLAYEFSGHSSMRLSNLGYAYAVSGEHDKANETLRHLLHISQSHYVPSYALALMYVALGDNEEAFTWLEKACDEHSHWVLFLGVEPMLDPLRADARFAPLLERAGLPHQGSTSDLLARRT
jgi:DNA-binding winged helix-turn-helix (wHTH) protein/Flp pilus assembly protein TadD